MLPMHKQKMIYPFESTSKSLMFFSQKVKVEKTKRNKNGVKLLKSLVSITGGMYLEIKVNVLEKKVITLFILKT